MSRVAAPTAAPIASQVALLTRRMVVNQFRTPAGSVPNLVMTVFFLFVYDGTMGGSETVAEIVGGSYTGFILPVVLLLASLAGGVAGFTLVFDLEQGYLRRQLSMPLSRAAIIAAPILTGGILVVIQAVIILALGLLIGVSSATGALGLLVLLAIALVWGVGIAGYAVAAGLMARNAQAIQAVLLVFFPVLFLAPTLLPRSELREWVDVVATVNPTTYVLDGMRALLVSGWDAGAILGAFAAGGAFAVAMLAWATLVAQRATARE